MDLTLLHAGILGMVEGFTEFLPISSTAHLVLISRLLNISQSDFLKTFEIAVQLGAILSVVVLYWKKLFRPDLIGKITTAFLPTAIIGFLLYKIVKSFLLTDITTILWAMGIGGLGLIIFEILYKGKGLKIQGQNISYKQSFWVGVAQSLSIIPGVSRAAATIIGGLMLGVSRETIVEFSFLLAVPTMFAATIYDVYKSREVLTISNLGLLSVGFVLSFLVAIISIKLLIKFIKNRTFVGFGIYRIILALAFWLFLK